MWSSTTTTSSTLSPHCLANMPIVAEPQPTRMRSSSLPLMIGALPACTITLAPPSTTSSTGLAVAEIEQRVAGDAALLLAAVGEVIDAAEREHLRAVFAGRHMADRLALGAHDRAFGAEMAVGVDLQLDAAIAVDALGDDGHHVDAVDLGRDDEGRGLVVGIGGAGADGGDERTGPSERCRRSRRPPH